MNKKKTSKLQITKKKKQDESNEILKIMEMIKLIYALPLLNKYLLKTIIHHLTNVISFEKENKMGVSNIAIVFVPSMNCNAKLFAFLILNYQAIFNPLCSKCSKVISIEENLYIDEDKLICKKCKFGEVEEEKKCNFVEATPTEQKKKGLIRSLSQKWKDRKKEVKKITNSESEDKSTEEESPKRWEGILKSSSKKKNGSSFLIGKKTSHNEPLTNSETSVYFERTSSPLSNSARIRPIESPRNAPNESDNENGAMHISLDNLPKSKEGLVLRHRKKTSFDFSENSRNRSNEAYPPMKMVINPSNDEKRNSRKRFSQSEERSSNSEERSSTSEERNSLTERSSFTERSSPTERSSLTERSNSSTDRKRSNTEVTTRVSFKEDTTSIQEEEEDPLLLFGSPLSKVVKKTSNSITLPSIVKKCIDYIEKKGLEIEEIYRIPGDIETVKNLRKTLKEGKKKKSVFLPLLILFFFFHLKQKKLLSILTDYYLIFLLIFDVILSPCYSSFI